MTCGMRKQKERVFQEENVSFAASRGCRYWLGISFMFKEKPVWYIVTAVGPNVLAREAEVELPPGFERLAVQSPTRG